MTGNEAVQTVYAGGVVQCSQREYDLEVRPALQEFAGKCAEDGDGIRMAIFLQEVRRLDRLFQENRYLKPDEPGMPKVIHHKGPFALEMQKQGKMLGTQKPAELFNYEQARRWEVYERIQQQKKNEPNRLYWYVSVDLGQAQDPSAMVVGTRTGPSRRHESKITIEAIRRWPLGTPYPKIVNDIVSVCDKPELQDPETPATLIIDRTGVGRGVVDFIRVARIQSGKLLVDTVRLMAITITGGMSAAHNDYWEWWVPKLDLVTSSQLALQNGCLTLPPAIAVPEVNILIEEMENFRYKPTAATRQMTAEAWREGDNDDLVLALGQLTYAAQMPSRGRNRWLGNM